MATSLRREIPGTRATLGYWTVFVGSSALMGGIDVNFHTRTTSWLHGVVRDGSLGLKESAEGVSTEPTLHIPEAIIEDYGNPLEALGFALHQAGIYVPQAIESSDASRAKDLHLADMRTLVAKYAKVEMP